jgi:hypothetical protein
MMKKTFFCLLSILLVCGIASITIAQRTAKVKKGEQKGKPATRVVTPVVPVTLGKSSHQSGPLTKDVFDSLIKQGLYADGYDVKSFTFSYAELNYYEDSVGNPIRVFDQSIEYCSGNMLSSVVSSSIFDRTKPGDTVYIDQIKLLNAKGMHAKGIALSIPIVKGK